MNGKGVEIAVKHEITTMNTRRTLAASLKKYMEKKPLSKITVSEIIADCGFNRKTFYYHFEDIYALLKWMLEEEAIEVVKQFDLLVDYREAVLFVMNYVRENKHLLCCAYDSMGRDEMKRFFYADFIGITRKLVCDAEQQLGVHAEDDFKEFLTHFYTEAVAGLLIDEFTNREGHDPGKAADYFALVLENSLQSVLKSMQKK
jgi:probable dihydroxyacetone kinase regulator